MAADSEIVTARKWGHSIGFTLSKKFVDKEKIMPNDQLIVTIKKVSTMKELAGTWKSKKSTQEIKDELKKGWD